MCVCGVISTPPLHPLPPSIPPSLSPSFNLIPSSTHSYFPSTLPPPSIPLSLHPTVSTHLLTLYHLSTIAPLLCLSSSLGLVCPSGLQSERKIHQVEREEQEAVGEEGWKASVRPFFPLEHSDQTSA